jgi:epoxyqueuosine reductase
MSPSETLSGRSAPVVELRSALATRGLDVWLPLSEAAFDRACAPVAPALSLRGLLGEAAPAAGDAVGAIVVGSGGRAFFAHFRAAPEASDGARNPLDRFTRATVVAAASETLGAAGVGHRIYFPFTDSVPALPFQRLGRAAGIGPPGPLGLQIHPTLGPWWAYRALIALAGAWSEPAPAEPLGDACAGCPAPCVAACPAGAVRLDGFSVVDCHARRRSAPACHLSCEARLRCVRGVEHRYSEEQLAFHMAASMPSSRP